MCGRIIRKTPSHLVVQDLGMEDDGPDLPPHYNIPPGSPVLALRTSASGKPELVCLKGGLIPSWAKDPKVAWKMINARAETAAEKPAFREALRKRRWLIPVDGFYEWKKTDDGKTPYFIRLREERMFLLAGLWERWISPAGETVETCTVITTRANDVLQPIHDRMPVIVARADWLVARSRHTRSRGTCAASSPLSGRTRDRESRKQAGKQSQKTTTSAASTRRRLVGRKRRPKRFTLDLIR
jgi:putative SOS response-associated peptidase YedK